MQIFKNIVVLISLIISCSFMLSIIPDNVDSSIPISIFCFHIMLFILYSLSIDNLDEEEISDRSYKKITKSKSDYMVLEEIPNKDEKIIKYKCNNSNKIYYMSKEDFDNNFI